MTDKTGADATEFRTFTHDGRTFREPVITSARRWEKEGLVFGTLRNWFLMTLYLCGVAPERLVRFYR